MSVAKLKLASERSKAQAKEILQEALESEPEAVIIFSFIDGEIVPSHGGIDSRLEIIGALEAAKIQMWDE